MNSKNSKKRICNLGILSFIPFLSTLLNAFLYYAVAETIQYAYDDARQVRRILYGSGTEIEYVYDGSGNRHDGKTAGEVVIEQKTIGLVSLKVIGDTAHGDGINREVLKEHGGGE